jgi:hypothetical protein
MAKKTLAVLVQERKTDDGMRVYGVYDRAGYRISEIEVIDCGQGAAQAHSRAKKLWQLSSADWALKLAREVCKRIEQAEAAKKEMQITPEKERTITGRMKTEFTSPVFNTMFGETIYVLQNLVSTHQTEGEEPLVSFQDNQNGVLFLDNANGVALIATQNSETVDVKELEQSLERMLKHLKEGKEIL